MRDYVLPSTPDEAARLVAEDPTAIVMGGGTTIVPRATVGELNGRRVIGLARAGLDGVQRNGALTLGAMTPLQAVAELDDVPALAAAARSIGAWPLRTTATVGGNLLVSRPYGDLGPVLLALDAEVGLAGGERMPLAQALHDNRPASGELLTEIVIPEPAGTVSFERCARLAAGAPPVVSVAARMRREGGTIGEARIALSAVGPRAFRATKAEDALLGSSGDEDAIEAAVDAAAGSVEAGDDAVASGWYRARMMKVHVRRALASALEGEAA